MLIHRRTHQFNRSLNVGRNIVFGFINRFFALLMPFIVRTVLIYRFGAVYLGLNSLLTSVFQVLNLAELGFGTAIVYSLYRPVAEQDTRTVCAYLGMFRSIYRVIGCIILVAGLAFMPVFPLLLKQSAVPGDTNLFVCYLIFLVDTAVSYLLFGYKTAIPSALQRNDLISKIDTAVMVAKSIVQIIFLLWIESFYFYLLVSLLFTVIRNLLISWMAERCFPQYVCKGNISKKQFAEMKRLVFGLALSKIREVSRNGFDNICITVFIGLTMTAVYDNYFCIHAALVSVSSVLCNAMMPSVGNSIAVESRDKNYCDMRRFNFMYMLLAGWITVCLFCLYQPFVKIWMGSDLMLGFPEVAAFCLYFYILKMGDMRWVYTEGAGLWWQARYIALAEIFLNLFLNVLLVQYWGVLGIIAATLFSLFFVNFICSAQILFRNYFRNSRLHEFFIDHVRYFLVTAGIAFLCLYLCEGIFSGSGESGLYSGIPSLGLRFIICTTVSVAGYFLAYHRSEQYRDATVWLTCRYRIVNKDDKEESGISG